MTKRKHKWVLGLVLLILPMITACTSAVDMTPGDSNIISEPVYHT